MLKFKVIRSPDGGYVWKRTVWPFPAFPNPLDTGHKRPKFNPNNHEESPV
jgi:hypothetical protein